MPRSSPSSGSLSSPSLSPSPPPTTRVKRTSPPSPPATLLSIGRKASATTKVSGLDSGSELSELTEDEQDNDGRSHGESSHGRPDLMRRSSSGRRKRGGIVPPQMWDWAYKNKKLAGELNGDEYDMENGESNETRDGEQTISSSTVVPVVPLKISNGDANDHTDEFLGNGDGGYSEGQIRKAIPRPTIKDELDDGDGEISTVDGVESGEEEEVGEPEHTPRIAQGKQREGSAELTEVEDGEDSPSPPGHDVESESESEPETDPDAASDIGESAAVSMHDNHEEELEPLELDEADVDVDVDAPIEDPVVTTMVPLAPAASSIMAGQQLIKTPTPTPSPSPSPEPEQEPARAKLMNDNDLDSGARHEDANASVGIDLETRDGDVDVDADADADNEVEAEEAELDMQPAHRAEALDVLAGIELKFAILRERLYVEKMEDLTMEEALVYQGIHPEMICLQNELQHRHDRRLDLAAKKRRYDDESVIARRKADENGVWSWWKFERDELQSEMFVEANRKRRKLERERRLLERPAPVRRIPQPPIVRTQPEPISLHDIMRSTPYDASFLHSRAKRKRKERDESIALQPHSRSHPSLSLLAPQEIQSDLQYLASRRPYYPLVSEVTLGPYPAVSGPPDTYMDSSVYGPGQPYSHGQQPPPPSGGHGFAPPGPRSVYHHNQAPPPTNHHPIHNSSRPIQGPGQLHVHQSRPPPGGYSGPSQPPIRRSVSPVHEHGPPVPLTGNSDFNHDFGSWYAVPNANGGPSGSKQAGVNSWGKDGRRGTGGSRDGIFQDGREREREREMELQREAAWHEKAMKDNQAEEQLRGQLAPPPLQQAQQVHRHTIQHQSLQGIPHHHHVVHHHHPSGPHHHHSPVRTGPGSAPALSSRRHELERHISAPELDTAMRRPASGPTVESFNLMDKQPNPSSSSTLFWKGDDADFARERGRPSTLLGSNAPPPSLLGPPPTCPPDRPQVTPFVMTPSQAMQTHFPGPGGSNHSRQDSWGEEAHRRPSSTSLGPSPPLDQSSRHQSSHVPHNAHSLPPVQSRQSSLGLASPRRVLPASPPLSTFPSQMHSPPRLAHPSGMTHPSGHASPRMSLSTLKAPRPITPLPAKIISTSSSSSSNFPFASTSGPGTPGTISNRMSTPNMNGPGGSGVSGRSDGFTMNGHPSGTSMSLFPSPSPHSGQALSHLPNVNSESPRLPPAAKMNVVQLGNGP